MLTSITTAAANIAVPKSAVSAYLEALGSTKAELEDWGDVGRLRDVEGIEALFLQLFGGGASPAAVSAYLEALDSTKAELEDWGDAERLRDIEGAEALFRSIFGIAAR